jgi:hypothetical protein
MAGNEEVVDGLNRILVIGGEGALCSNMLHSNS